MKPWDQHSLLSFFESVYKPQRLCGKPDSTVRAYRIEIGNLCRWYEFQQWDAAGAGAMYDPESVDRHCVKLIDLSDELIAGAMEWRLSLNIKASTVNKLHRHILPLWRFARRKYKPLRKVIDEPMVDKAVEVEYLPEAYSDDEFVRIMQQARSLPGLVGSHARWSSSGKAPACVFWPAFIGTVYDVAGRYSDVYGAQAAKLDLVSGVLKMQVDKQHFEKHFELSHETVDDLRALAPFFTDRIFGGWPLTKRMLTKHYKQFILKPAGLPYTNPERKAGQWFHKLRKTMLTNITIEHGIDEAQKYAGHSHRTVTERYVDKTKIKSTVSARSMPRPVTAGLKLRSETG